MLHIKLNNNKEKNQIKIKKKTKNGKIYYINLGQET
jgi:hypothetical protein